MSRVQPLEKMSAMKYWRAAWCSTLLLVKGGGLHGAWWGGCMMPGGGRGGCMVPHGPTLLCMGRGGGGGVPHGPTLQRSGGRDCMHSTAPLCHESELRHNPASLLHAPTGESGGGECQGNLPCSQSPLLLGKHSRHEPPNSGQPCRQTCVARLLGPQLLPQGQSHKDEDHHHQDELHQADQGGSLPRAY